MYLACTWDVCLVVWAADNLNLQGYSVSTSVHDVAFIMLRSLQVFNAILGDPPYGVRAGGRKSVSKEVTVRYRDTHIPSTEPYSLTECLADLLELAAQTLVVGVFAETVQHQLRTLCLLCCVASNL